MAFAKGMDARPPDKVSGAVPLMSLLWGLRPLAPLRLPATGTQAYTFAVQNMGK